MKVEKKQKGERNLKKNRFVNIPQPHLKTLLRKSPTQALFYISFTPHKSVMTKSRGQTKWFTNHQEKLVPLVRIRIPPHGFPKAEDLLESFVWRCDWKNITRKKIDLKESIMDSKFASRKTFLIPLETKYIA